MNLPKLRTFTSIGFSLALALSTLSLAAVQATAQCPEEVVSGLRTPLGTALSNQGNLLVSETGTTALNSGRISIVDADGNRRTLLDGLPSAINDVAEPSGPAGLFMRGRTLYVAIGVGDVGRRLVLPPPLPPVTIPNPDPISSPIFSSVLAIQFSAKAENITNGFTLTGADQQALADGQTVALSNGSSDRITIRLVANLPNFISFPLPFFAGNIQLSNPFQLVAVEDDLYVTDGGRNLVWHIDLLDGSFSVLASFPPIPNPALPVGPPVLDTVPTGITAFGDHLLVTLFTGFPFPPGASTVEQIDPLTGSHTAFITGLRTAIDVLPITEDDDTDFLVLQHNSGTQLLPPWSGPGQLLRFETPAGPPVVVTSCLTRPTTMELDRKSNTLYISELGGRIVSLSIAP